MLFSFNTILLAIAQIFILGGLGFFLLRKKIISEKGLDELSHLLVKFILPSLIFVQLIKNFNFSLYKNWWVFPLLSIAINFLGLAIAWFFLKTTRLECEKNEFLSLVSFQNSGYLPLVLVKEILPPEIASGMFVYIFLFLMGFNGLIWSYGVRLLKNKKTKDYRLSQIFSPPLLAVLFGLLVVGLGWDKFIPQFMLKPLSVLGDCTFPLALIVVGASLAEISFVGSSNKRLIFDIILLKQVFLPALALIILSRLNLGFLFGLLIILETAMPPATSLAIISRYYRDKETLISQGIFFGHIVSIFTIPLFLYLFGLLTPF